MLHVDEAIQGRRSIRHYKTDPVPDTIVEEILDLARQAPSSMDGQPWEFIVVRDRATLAELGNIKDRYCPPGKSAYKALMFQTAPLAIAVCVDRLKSHDRSIENGTLATAYLMLAAHSRGLGTVFLTATNTAEPNLEQEIRTLLHIPDSVIPINIIPVGYPDEHPHHKAVAPLRVFEDAYGGNRPDPGTDSG